jgi:hypothetical protein
MQGYAWKRHDLPDYLHALVLSGLGSLPAANTTTISCHFSSSSSTDEA